MRTSYTKVRKIVIRPSRREASTWDLTKKNSVCCLLWSKFESRQFCWSCLTLGQGNQSNDWPDQTRPDQTRSDQTNMSSLPTGCCAVQWAMWKGGGLTSRDRPNSSENYLLLGFLLVRPVQIFLLLVREPITQDNCSISVSYRSSSNVTCLKNLLTLENKMKLFRKVELGQETIKSRNEVLPFFQSLSVALRSSQEEHLLGSSSY